MSRDQVQSVPGLPASFCPAPWTSIQIDPSGSFRPCCYYAAPIRRDDGSPFHASDTTLREVWESDDLQRIRDAHVAGERIVECDRCWRVEDSGGHSKRLGFVGTTHDIWPEIRDGRAVLHSLELNVSNRCNLMCRTCGPEQSASLLPEQQRILRRLSGWLAKDDSSGDTAVEDSRWRAIARSPMKERLRTMPVSIASTTEPESLWNEIEPLLTSLVRIDLLGGEPMLIRAYEELLDRCVRSGHAAHIHLAFTTNGTIRPERWIELGRNFRCTTISVSLDAVGDRFEYMRHPASWDRVQANVRRMREAARVTPESLEVICNATLSMFNMLYIDELAMWATREGIALYPFHVSGARYLDTRVLTTEAKEEAKRRIYQAIPELDGRLARSLTSLVNLMYTDDWSSEWLPVFRAMTSLVDEERAQRFEDTFPELVALLEP